VLQDPVLEPHNSDEAENNEYPFAPIRLSRLGDDVGQPVVEEVGKGDPGWFCKQGRNDRHEQGGGVGEEGEGVPLAGKALDPESDIEGISDRGQGHAGEADDQEVLDAHRPIPHCDSLDPRIVRIRADSTRKRRFFL